MAEKIIPNSERRYMYHSTLQRKDLNLETFSKEDPHFKIKLSVFFPFFPSAVLPREARLAVRDHRPLLGPGLRLGGLLP